MEHEQFRKKVYMQTLSSTLINHKTGLTPQWTSDNLLNFNSAYEFASYNIQEELMQILPRDQGENEVIAAKFRSQLNENKCEMYYIYKEKESYFLVHQPNERNKHILIYQNTQQKREKIVHKFLDFLLNDKEQMKSSKHLINRTQQMIEDISENRNNEDLNESVQQMQDVKQLLILPQCGFSVMLVQMKKKNGIMLVNLDKSAKQKKKDFYCPIVGVNLNRSDPNLTEEESHSSKIIYIFPQTILEIHKTSDITRFIILTEKYLIMVKLNYDLMELCIQHKLDISQRFKGKILSLGVTNIGDEDFIIALFQAKPYKPISSKLMKEIKQKRLLKLLTVVDKKIVQVKQNKHGSKAPKYSFQEKTLKFLDEDCCEKPGNIRFNDNVVQSRYQIEDNDDFLNNDFNQNVIMTVFNSMLSEESRQHQKAISIKEQSFKNFFTNEGEDDDSSVKTNNNHKAIQQIGGFVVNKNLVIVWEKSEAILHICKLISKKQQEDNYNNEKQELNRTKEKDQMMRQKQMKDMYAQLMGLPLPEKKETKVYFEPKLEYFTTIQLELTYPKIQSISVSPNNYNLLLISASGNQHKEALTFNVFQLELFIQLSNPDPNMFIKPIKNIHKKKQIEQINNSLVKDTALFLTGNLIHSLENELLEGALSFDIHPYHHFMAVSFGFTTKIYAIEGNDRLTSLFTLNGQGMKAVKYSPMGNHLCILFSKYIKIIDAYSFSSRFSIHQKNSNFVRCSFSSNGLQFYTISENHAVNVYNTFDYTKIDSIKPSSNMLHQIEYKPIFMKSFLKQSQYCLVLEDGGLYVKYKPDAVVMAHQQIYHYEDEEKIISIQIDEKNGVLFTGCLSGKLRTHIWPMKQQHNFQNFTQIRISFSSISCLSLSSISALLYVGNHNGNISKVKYIIDRDKGLETPKEHTSLMTDKNIRFMNLGGPNKIQKIYKFVLFNSSSLTEQLPQKLRLEYKLSEVINKLNDEMKKLKVAIHNELQEKEKISTERFDINLYHHLNQMITTKLYTQLKEQEEMNNKQLNIIKQKYSKELKDILSDQNLLLNQKSLNISQNYAERTSLKQQQAKQFHQQQKKYNQLLNKSTGIVNGVEKVKNEQQDTLFYLPNDNIDNDKAQKKDLIRQLERQNTRHFDLRKACTYKETAIKGMLTKKIKEETLQFKIKLEATQMNNKLQYNRKIIKELKDKIEEAEQKVHKVQAQASIIKNSAQFKRVANIEEMNDACSYKLWMKEKIQTEISDLVAYYRLLEEILDDKSSEIVGLVGVKINKLEQVVQLNHQISSQKEKLHSKKLELMDTHTVLKRINPMKEFRALKTANNSSRNSPSIEKKDIFKSSNTSRDREHLSSRKLSKVNKDVTLYNNIMEKEMNFLKTNVKIHQRKINKFGKQNGQLLTQYEKLKYENKKLKETELFNKKSIDKVQLALKKNEVGKQQELVMKPSLQLAKTSFQKYLEIKQSKQTHSLKYKTASSTPTHLKTPSARQFL